MILLDFIKTTFCYLPHQLLVLCKWERNSDPTTKLLPLQKWGKTSQAHLFHSPFTGLYVTANRVFFTGAHSPLPFESGKANKRKIPGLILSAGEKQLDFFYMKYKWNQERQDGDAITAQHREDWASSSDSTVEFLCSLARSFYFCVPTDLKIGSYHARTWVLI